MRTSVYYLLLAFFSFLIAAVPASAQVIVTAAGNGTGGYSGDGQPATQAELNQPYGVALDDSGNLYICDNRNWRIRKVSPAYGGIITTIAGNGTPGYSGDHGLGVNAQISNVYDIAVDHHGNVYIADVVNSCIRKITPSDTITTIAGTGAAGYNGDNILATAAQLNIPYCITSDSIGNIYIADRFNYRIRKIDTAGMITTVAGCGIAGFSPDSSLADTACINNLLTVKTDRKGNLFFSDNNRIRELDVTSGMITTVAGNGTQGYTGDSGLATEAEITAEAIALDNAGNLFIADGDANHIREVNTEGIIITVAGSVGGYGGDNGPPLLAKMNLPAGIAVNDSGDIYIGDVGNNRVRLVTTHPIGVNNINLLKQNISVYPNPSAGTFNFLFSSPIDEQAQVSISNIFGEQVKEFTVNANQLTKVVLNASPGIYYLSTTTKWDVSTQKIIIQ